MISEDILNTRIDEICNRFQTAINNIVQGFEVGADWLDGETLSFYVTGDFNEDVRKNHLGDMNEKHLFFAKELEAVMTEYDPDYILHETEGWYWKDGEEVDGDADFDGMNYILYPSK